LYSLRLRLSFGSAFQGKASVRGVSDSRCSHSASLRITSSVSAFVHPCPKNDGSRKFPALSVGVNRPLHPSFTSFGRGSAMSAVYAFACHRPSIHHRRSGSRLCCSQIQQTAKRSSHRTRSVGQRSLPKITAPPTITPISPPTHPRKSSYVM
jgi:hypothetical protein